MLLAIKFGYQKLKNNDFNNIDGRNVTANGEVYRNNIRNYFPPHLAGLNLIDIKSRKQFCAPYIQLTPINFL